MPLTEHVAALEAATEVFKSAPQAPPPQDQQVLVRSLADRIKGDAAKIGVMLGDGGGSGLSASEAAGLLNTLQQATGALCACMHSLTYQAGPTLRDDLKSGATSVVTQCVALAKLMMDSKATSKAVTHAVGAVWSTCDAVKKQALDNKSALFRRLAGAMRAGKDALREMNELAQENELESTTLSQVKEEVEEANGQGPEVEDVAATSPSELADTADQQPEPGDEAEGETGMPDERDDADFSSDALSPSELEVLKASQQLMQLALQSMQLMARPLITATDLSVEAVEGWESCVWHTRSLQRGLEDLGAALYAPQDHEEVGGAAEAIVISLECMLDEIPDTSPPEGAATGATGGATGGSGGGDGVSDEQLGALQAQITLVKSRLDGLLAAAEAEA